MHKSVLTFGFLMSSLRMLAIVPFLNNNNPAMAQGYYDDSSYSQYPPMTRNMSVEQVHSKDSL